MRQVDLIINGDDFGVSEEVNEAIIQAHKKGVLTSCSLMAGGEAFEQAVHLAKQNEGLAVGIHLVAVKGRSVLPPAKIPHIVDENGCFPDDPTMAGIRYFFQESARRELQQELKAQFAKIAGTGLRISHIDGHLHMHIHPVIFSAAAELGRYHNVPGMRVPHDDFALAWGIDRSGSAKSAVQAMIFALLCRRMKARLDREGFTYTKRVHGHFFTGRITEHAVLSTLDRIRSGTREIYFHPALYPAGRALTPSEMQCQREFEILISENVKARLQRPAFHLTTYPRL